MAHIYFGFYFISMQMHPNSANSFWVVHSRYNCLFCKKKKIIIIINVYTVASFALYKWPDVPLTHFWKIIEMEIHWPPQIILLIKQVANKCHKKRVLYSNLLYKNIIIIIRRKQNDIDVYVSSRWVFFFPPPYSKLVQSSSQSQNEKPHGSLPPVPTRPNQMRKLSLKSPPLYSQVYSGQH